ncbi:MAG: hypothetical protein V4724_41230, partial [Pseudomonadota bacterium]
RHSLHRCVRFCGEANYSKACAILARHSQRFSLSFLFIIALFTILTMLATIGIHSIQYSEGRTP